jgi:hypothetical protein
MPLHDWTRVPAGLFHDFHQSWSIRIKDALNAGRLPDGTIALVEQRSGPREPDVLAIETTAGPRLSSQPGVGLAVLEPPVASLVQRADRALYARRANRIVIRHHLSRVIAVIEIISPGNKDSRTALERFAKKTVEFLEEDIHILVIDLFPPTPRDPSGIHKLIWDELHEEPFAMPAGKDRLLASYESGIDLAAYLEFVAVGDSLPDMPLFLTRERTPNFHVMVPMESTYLATWEATPNELRVAVETGVLPNPDA